MLNARRNALSDFISTIIIFKFCNNYAFRNKTIYLEQLIRIEMICKTFLKVNAYDIYTQ